MTESLRIWKRGWHTGEPDGFTTDESRAVTEKLYFNGINGATGEYGLRPMTATALAERLLEERFGTARQLRDLERLLTHRTANERKILAIVELLVRDVVAMQRGDDLASGHQDSWFVTMARRILSILFDASSEPNPGDVEILAAKLRQQPASTIVRIIKLLNSGEGAALVQWLLDEDAANPAVLRGGLESRFDQALVRIQRSYLQGEPENIVTQRGVVRTDWVEAFCWDLDQLPVESLKTLPSVDPIGAPLRRLIYRLGALNDLLEGHMSTLIEPQRKLAALSALGPDASWHEVVRRLNGFLMALHFTSQSVDAVSLRDALREWLNELRRAVVGQLGPVPWVDPKRLDQSGWGIIFPAIMPDDRCQAIQKALAPLLALRRRQAGDLYSLYAGRNGYRPGDSATIFLHRPPRNASAANPADPEATGVPYYLLIVGTPEQIPFDFQYQLDVQYAVGRLDFGEDLPAYERYARNVVAAEGESFAHNPQAVFFGTDNPGDEATSLTSKHLIAPLHRHFVTRMTGAAWQFVRVAPENATKANLLRVLRLEAPPALLFAATHGLEFDAGDPRQVQLQGALLCQDWQGGHGEVPSDSFLAAQDITSGMNLRGMILFLFACFGAGTPKFDEYHRSEFRVRAKPIAETPFVAALPKAMLALRDRGALAVIGHVERTWGLSFLAELPHRPEGMHDRQREHIEVFAAALERLLDGHPVGSAMDFFDMRYAALATELTSLYDRIGDPPSLDDAFRLAELWTANNDARGYVIVGDPAVRLRGIPAGPKVA